jgi:hypothetical protein
MVDRGRDVSLIVGRRQFAVSLNKDLRAYYRPCAEKTKASPNLESVYASVARARRVAELGLAPGLCLESVRNPKRLMLQRLARHQLPVEYGKRVASGSRSFWIGLI